jgi:hypothetical protein
MKKRTIIGLVIAGFFLVMLAVTNPGKDEYVSWINEEVAQSEGGMLEKGLFAVFGNMVMEQTTESTDYILFSVYRTTIDGEGMTAVGVLNRFIPL